jgi:hypothetical protein
VDRGCFVFSDQSQDKVVCDFVLPQWYRGAPKTEPSLKTRVPNLLDIRLWREML